MVCWRILLFRKDQGCVVDAACKFLIKHVETHAVVSDEGVFVDEGAAIVFFLHLLADKPVEAVAGSVVFLGFSQRVETVDESGHFFLVFEGSLEGFERRCL